MSSLTLHRSAHLSRRDGIADTAYYFNAAGGSGSNVTFAAPSGRVPGSIMVAWVNIDTNIAGGTLWDPTLADAHWTDSGVGIWASGANRRGRSVYRVADGTANDDLILTKTGGTATGVRVILVALRGYTNTETPNRLSVPTASFVGASPRLTNVQSNANGATPVGLYVAVLVADNGTHPLGISANGLAGVTGATRHEVIDTGGSDPYLELWQCPILAALGTSFPNPTLQFNATAPSGTLFGWSNAAVLVP